MKKPLGKVNDREFVSLFDLSRKELSEARKKAEAGDCVGATDELLTAVRNRPLTDCTTPEEARRIGKMLARDYPDRVEHLKEYLRIAAEKPKRTFSWKSLETFRKYHDFGADARQYKLRGRGLYMLGQLYLMTGDKTYSRKAASLLKEMDALTHIDLKDDDAFIPIMPWHPNYDPRTDELSVSHIMETLGITLPMFWDSWGREDRKYAVWYLARLAEISYRGYKDDPSFNIPLHGLVGMLHAAIALPQLKNAPKWKALMDRNLGKNGVSVSAPIVTSDGYHREGLGYQWVNQWLLVSCYVLYERAGGAPESLRKVVKAGFELAAATVRPDGMYFLVGDMGARASHEHEMEHHEILHLGAALFNRPDFKERAGALRSKDLQTLLAFLMGEEGYKRWRKMPYPDMGSRRHVSVGLTDAGFLHLKAGKGVKGSTHGLLNAALSHNHGHFDCLSVSIFGQGRELVSDSGTISYDLVDVARQEEEHAHAVFRLGHLKPRGPRHISMDAVTLKLLKESKCGRINAAMAEHRLVEDHILRRALILCLPEGDETGNGFWIVWDRLVHADTEDGCEPPATRNAPAPARVTETLFPLHAPGGRAVVKGLTGWSLHSPDDYPVRLNDEKRMPFTCAEACNVLECSDSDANIQVTAIPISDSDCTEGLEIIDGFCSQLSFPAKRPTLSFKWRGHIPHEAVYVLAPYKGIAETEPFDIGGWCGNPSKPGALEASIQSRNGELCIARAEGLAGNGATVTLDVPGQQTARLSFRIG